MPGGDIFISEKPRYTASGLQVSNHLHDTCQYGGARMRDPELAPSRRNRSFRRRPVIARLTDHS